MSQPLREKCPYSELFWSAFSHIRTEYGEIPSISLYSVRVRENTDQNNFEYGHILRIELQISRISLLNFSIWTSLYGHKLSRAGHHKKVIDH